MTFLGVTLSRNHLAELRRILRLARDIPSVMHNANTRSKMLPCIITPSDVLCAKP
jgi:hypothetical protein